MKNYVDGFVLPIPKKNVKAYSKFPQSVKLKSNEVVFFSWIVYKSRQHRDKFLKKVMSEPRIKSMGPGNMPFDAKRMIYGGFQPLINM